MEGGEARELGFGGSSEVACLGATRGVGVQAGSSAGCTIDLIKQSLLELMTCINLSL
jgi:hypothetical protein